MTPTLTVARLDGHGTEHLSLHTRPTDAQGAVVDAGRAAWRARFGYDLPAGLTHSQVIEHLGDEGWRVRITDEPVAL